MVCSKASYKKIEQIRKRGLQIVYNEPRVPVKASSFVIDELFSSFDKSGFLTSKQK